MSHEHRPAVASRKSARDVPMNPPKGWNWDLWQQFRLGAIYEDEVPRDADGEPLLDADGNPRNGLT